MTTRRDFLKIAATAPILGMDVHGLPAPAAGQGPGGPSPAPANGEPLYLGRCFEEWWADFLSAEYEAEMKTAPQLSFRHPLRDCFAWWDCARGWPLNVPGSLVCQALPYFGAAFWEKAAEAFWSLDEWRQTQLVSCFVTVSDLLFALLHLLEEGGPSVRAAACAGLPEYIYSTDVAVPSYALRLQETFLRNPTPSRAEMDAVLEIYVDRCRIVEVQGGGGTYLVASALIKRLEDDYPTVRLAAVVLASMLLATDRRIIAPALVKRLVDDCQVVRIEVMNAFGLEENPWGPSPADDARLYEHRLGTEHRECRVEIGNNWIMGCFRQLLHDPDARIRARIAKVMALCEMGRVIENLGHQEAHALIQSLEEAGPVTGRYLVARQEATWALQWLVEQWTFSDPHRKNVPEPESPKAPAAIPSTIREPQEEIAQLTAAPLEKVVAALRSRDIAFRMAALDRLPYMSRAGEGLARYVVDRLADSCEQVRRKARWVLTTMALRKVPDSGEEARRR